MERAVIGVTGPADRLLSAGLAELTEIFEALGQSVLVVGGLMTKAWLHARPTLDLPARATANVDLGIDRKGLRISGDRRVVRPLLEKQGFSAGLGEDVFRFSKELADGTRFTVDLLVAPGASKEEPPLLESGIPTFAVPGLAYALLRGGTQMAVEFVDGTTTSAHTLPMPQLDAAFVLKGVLVKKQVRVKPGRLETDTVDAIMLAALCRRDQECIAALAEHRGRSDVAAALGWLRSLDTARARAPRRIEEHFRREDGLEGAGAWAVEVAEELVEAVAS